MAEEFTGFAISHMSQPATNARQLLLSKMKCLQSQTLSTCRRELDALDAAERVKTPLLTEMATSSFAIVNVAFPMATLGSAVACVAQGTESRLEFVSERERQQLDRAGLKFDGKGNGLMARTRQLRAQQK